MLRFVSIDTSTMVYEQFAGNDFAHGQLGNEAFYMMDYLTFRYNFVLSIKKKCGCDLKAQKLKALITAVEGFICLKYSFLYYQIDHFRQNIPILCHAPNC